MSQMQDRELHFFQRTLPLYAVIFGVAVLFIGTVVLEIPKLVILHRRGVVIEGEITGYDKSIRETTYRYRFDGVEYTGTAVIKGSLSPGTRWIVTVDPQMPSRHSSGSASETLFSRSAMLGFLSIVLLGGGAIALVRHINTKILGVDRQNES